MRPATWSVTGAEVATRNARCASASSAVVVVGATRTVGSETGPPRSSDASDATIAVDATVRSSFAPARSGTTATRRPV